MKEYIEALTAPGFHKIQKFELYEHAITWSPLHTHDSIRQQFERMLHSRLGSLSTMLVNNKFLETLYRRRLSRVNRVPGRLVTFLAHKQP